MISVPLYFLLLPYAAFLLAVAFFSLVNIVNLLRYGARNSVGFMATFLFIAGTAIILFFSWQGLSQFDWGARVPVIPAGVIAS